MRGAWRGVDPGSWCGRRAVSPPRWSGARARRRQASVVSICARPVSICARAGARRFAAGLRCRGRSTHSGWLAAARSVGLGPTDGHGGEGRKNTPEWLGVERKERENRRRAVAWLGRGEGRSAAARRLARCEKRESCGVGRTPPRARGRRTHSARAAGAHPPSGGCATARAERVG